jgi:hypothetical protein
MMRGTFKKVLGFIAQISGDILEDFWGQASMALFIAFMVEDADLWKQVINNAENIISLMEAQINLYLPTHIFAYPPMDLFTQTARKALEAVSVIDFIKLEKAQEDEYPFLPTNPDQWFQGPINP